MTPKVFFLFQKSSSLSLDSLQQLKDINGALDSAEAFSLLLVVVFLSDIEHKNQRVAHNAVQLYGRPCLVKKRHKSTRDEREGGGGSCLLRCERKWPKLSVREEEEKKHCEVRLSRVRAILSSSTLVCPLYSRPATTPCRSRTIIIHIRRRRRRCYIRTIKKRRSQVLVLICFLSPPRPRSLPGLPKDFVPKDPKLLLPKDFQPNKEFHPKIGHEDEDEDDDHGDHEGDMDDVDHPNSFPSMPGSLPRTNAGHGK